MSVLGWNRPGSDDCFWDGADGQVLGPFNFGYLYTPCLCRGYGIGGSVRYSLAEPRRIAPLAQGQIENLLKIYPTGMVC